MAEEGKRAHVSDDEDDDFVGPMPVQPKQKKKRGRFYKNYMIIKSHQVFHKASKNKKQPAKSWYEV